MVDEGECRCFDFLLYTDFLMWYFKFSGTHENLDEGELVIYGMENRSVNDEASTRIRKAEVFVTPKKCKLENTGICNFTIN